MRTLIGDTPAKAGETVFLEGWVDGRRDHGKIMFLDMRDRTGVVQLVSNKALGDARSEDCIAVEGVVKRRPEQMVNPNLPTGTVEVEVTKLTIYSKAAELPFPVDSDGRDINEEIRLKYRYLDLRRSRLARNIRLRSRIVDSMRQQLFGQGFTEIETPMLTKSTPEGSRDFLVPSRLQPGKFYALPQSPQQYKQLLMVAGFERYFQIARCMRDEDLRADRGFEHTQLDLEMSFVKREDVMATIEAMTIAVVEGLGGKIRQKPFPVITYKQAMETYGADKFDMRTPEEKRDGIHAFAWVVDFPFFEKDKDGNWTYTHNPFSDIVPEQKEAFLNGQIEGILTTQYDLVWNGYEAGGGSVRSTDPVILSKVFEVLGHKKEDIDAKFGHMLKAFSFGVPPHGGIALGIDRFTMCMTGETSIKEVQAFPQTSSGQTSVMDAPSAVEADQLAELGIAVTSLKGGEAVYEAIVKDLTKAGVAYETYTHKEVTTSEEAATVRNTPIGWGAKAIVMFADGNPVMVVLAGDTKVDMKAFKHLYTVRDLRMAKPEEVEAVTGTVIGAVPPFGHLFHIPLYMDEGVRKNETVVFNAGLRTKSVMMGREAYESVAHPTVGAFAKAKEG